MVDINSKSDKQFSDTYKGDFSSFVKMQTAQKGPVTVATITANFLKSLLAWQEKYVNRYVKITIETIEGNDGEVKTESSIIEQSEVVIRNTK